MGSIFNLLLLILLNLKCLFLSLFLFLDGIITFGDLCNLILFIVFGIICEKLFNILALVRLPGIVTNLRLLEYFRVTGYNGGKKKYNQHYKKN